MATLDLAPRIGGTMQGVQHSYTPSRGGIGCDEKAIQSSATERGLGRRPRGLRSRVCPTRTQFPSGYPSATPNGWPSRDDGPATATGGDD
jgi:hypothetical protein